MVKKPPANAGDVRDMGLIPGSGRPLEEEMANHGVAELDTTEVTEHTLRPGFVGLG